MHGIFLDISVNYRLTNDDPQPEDMLLPYPQDFQDLTYTVTLNITYSSFYTLPIKLDPISFHGLTDTQINALPAIISEAIAKLKDNHNSKIEFA